MMKKIYQEPDLQSMELETVDTITASGGTSGGTNGSETDNAYIGAGDLFATPEPGGGWF